VEGDVHSIISNTTVPTFVWMDSRKLQTRIESLRGQELNPGPIEYKVGVLSTPPQRSV
jgi:hypothetical protein